MREMFMIHEGYSQPRRISLGLMKDGTFIVRFTWLLGQQHTGEHLLPGVGILVGLEGEERLRLVL